jgi:gamma-D-glutamyl-L-lysine dipeptidyl-peptidase
MKFGICLLSVIPVRSEPSDKAEITTQLLFGELVVINEIWENWMMIRNIFDNYEGWVDLKQVIEIGEEEFHRLNRIPSRYTKDLVEVINGESGYVIPVVYGSTIKNEADGKFQIKDSNYYFTGQLCSSLEIPRINSIIEDALLFLNAPYQWGGKTPFGIDCSGLTQTVFKTNGIELLRDAVQQATQGETISLIDEAEPGDLAFFDNSEGNIVHVGILYKKNKIIHASGKVRIDSIDHHGIYNSDLQKYTHQLRIIKRLI